MKKLRKENSITIINIISSFILQGIAFLTTPVFTRMLGTEQFGLYSLFNSWLLIITCVMGLGIHASIGTGYYNFKEKYCEFRNSILLFSTIICLIESLILIMFMSYFNKYVGFNETVIVLLVVCAFGKYIVNFVQNAYIYEKKQWKILYYLLELQFFQLVYQYFLYHYWKKIKDIWVGYMVLF